MLLATDLDGTFLGGSDAHREQLYQLIKNEPSIQLVFVTGRGLETVLPILKDVAVPVPHYIICDVGSTVVDGQTLQAIQPLQAAIKEKWPGAAAVHEKMKALPELKYQQVPQQRRSSYFVSDHALVAKAKELAEEIGCDVIYSAGKFLDILPKGVNKGSTLSMLVEHLETEKDDILVAGDTLNDLSMYQRGYKGVVVGEAEQKLLDVTKTISNIFHSTVAGAGGIIEAIKHFKFLKKSTSLEMAG